MNAQSAVALRTPVGETIQAEKLLWRKKTLWQLINDTEEEIAKEVERKA